MNPIQFYPKNVPANFTRDQGNEIVSYALTPEAMAQVSSTLSTKDFWTALSTLFASDTANLIYGIMLFPFDVKQFSTSTSGTFTVGGKAIQGSALTNVPTLKGAASARKVCEFSIPKKTSFLDFEPYTRMELYVPTVGFMSLPINEIPNEEGKLVVYLSLDFVTGEGTITVCWTDMSTYGVPGANESLFVLNVQNVKMGVSCPIVSSNTRDVIRESLAKSLGMISSAIDSAAKAASVVSSGKKKGASGDSMSPVGAILDLAAWTITHPYLRQTSGSYGGDVSKFFAPTEWAILVYSTEKIEPPAFASLRGYATAVSMALSGVQGYARCVDVHIEGEAFKSATTAEIELIYNELRKGVLF